MCRCLLETANGIKKASSLAYHVHGRNIIILGRIRRRARYRVFPRLVITVAVTCESLLRAGCGAGSRGAGSSDASDYRAICARDLYEMCKYARFYCRQCSSGKHRQFQEPLVYYTLVCGDILVTVACYRKTLGLGRSRATTVGRRNVQSKWT